MKGFKLIKILLLLVTVVCSAVFALSCTQKEPNVIYVTPSVEIDDYVEPQVSYNKYGNITIDGNPTEEEWGNQQKLNLIEYIGGIQHTIEASAYFAEEGLVVYFTITGAPVFYNQCQHPNQNSGIELYVAPHDAVSVKDCGWQIGLDAAGNYLATKYLKKGGSLDYQYLLFNTFVDFKATVDGELNSTTSNGYAMEIMFPWSNLNFDSAPESIKIDFAVIFRSEVAGSRNAWYSLSSANNPAYGFQVPTSWFRFTKDGYFDESATAPLTVNNGNGVENCSVNIVGNYRNGITVNVEPDKGYRVSMLKINGINYDTLTVNLPAQKDWKADVEVCVEQFTGNEYTFNVLSGFAYGGKTPAKNTSITFVSSDNVLYPTNTDANGSLKITLPAGDYEVKSQNFENVSIKLTDDKLDGYEIVLLRKVFKDVTGGEVIDGATCVNGSTFKFEDATANFTSFWENNIRVSLGDIDYSSTVIYDYKVTFRLRAKMYSSIMFMDENGAWCRNAFLNFGTWDSNDDVAVKSYKGATLYVFNKNNATLTTKNGNSYLTISLYMVINGNKLEAFAINNGKLVSLGTYTESASLNRAFIGTTDNLGRVEYTEFKVYDGKEAKEHLSATVSVDANDLVDVDAPLNIYYGQTSLVTITPKQFGDSIVLINAKVNGKAVELTNNDDGSKTFNLSHLDSSISGYSVEISASTVTPVNTTFNVTGVDISGNTHDVDDLTIKLEGVINTEVVLQDGKFSATLPAGSYLLKVDGYEKTSIMVVDGVNNYSVKLAKTFFVDNVDFTTGYDQEDGYHFTSKVNNKFLYVTNLNVTNNLKFSFTYTGMVGAGHRQWVEIVATSSNGDKMSIQFLTWDSNFVLKEPKYKGQKYIYQSSGAYTEDFTVILQDGYFTVNYSNGNFVVDKTWNGLSALSDVTSISFYYGNETHSDWSVTNLKIGQP
jgi:hypothetical protein